MRSLLFLLGLCAGVMIGCSRNESSDDSRQTDLNKTTNRITATDESPVLIQPNATTNQTGPEVRTNQNSVVRAELANESTNPADSFTVVVDTNSGRYAAVSGDGHVIALKDKSGIPIWTNDIIAKYGTNLPRYSSGKIGSLEFIEGQIVIYVGKECICIEPQSGKILRTASR